VNLAKSKDVFNPEILGNDYIHIIGCGATGSCIGELLARYGITKFCLWDMDTVESKNVNNQMFNSDYIGWPKVEALRDIIVAINPEAEADIVIKPNGWWGEQVRGYVFLLMDNIDTCRKFCEVNKNNTYLKCVINTRTGLFDAQCWSADWSNPKNVEGLLASMNFSHEEAAAETPRSSCGETLGVAATGRMITNLAVINFIRFLNGSSLRIFMSIDTDLSHDGEDLIMLA